MKWEQDYLRLVYDVVNNGWAQPSRAGDVHMALGKGLSITGLKPGEFPLLNSRKMYIAGVAGELAAFLRGADNVRVFQKYGCNYWNDFANENGGLGPIYGVQWRYWPNSIHEPVDQIRECRELTRKDPYSRRILLTTWNPAQTNQMALPPCHIICQFHVRGNKLSASVYMRSVDLCLGLPSDIVLYYLLLILMAHDTGYEPHELHFSFGNAHVYEAHVATFIDEHYERVDVLGNMPVPTYKILKPGFELTNIFTPDMLVIENYRPMAPIQYKLLV